MLNKIGKYLPKRLVCAALAVILAQTGPANADIGSQAFSDGQPHVVTDNIIGTGYGSGLSVRNTGTSAVMSDRFITTTNGYGVWADNNGTITLNNVAVSTSGDSGCYGIFAGPGSTINMTGGSINTTGEASVGAYPYLDGPMTLTNVAITTSGYYSSGIYNGWSTLTMTGGSITTTGDVSYGAHADYLAYFTMTDSSIVTSGSSSHGVMASQESTMTLNNVTITTNGDSLGAFAYVGSTINMTGGSITTNGDFSHGAYAYMGSTINMTGGAITTHGNESHGTYIEEINFPTDFSDGAINLTNVAVTTTGAGSYALATITRGIINATVDGQDISGSGGLIKADNGSVVNLAASGSSRLYGSTTVASGGTANVTLNGNAAWTMPGDSNLTTLTMNGGSVRFTAPADAEPYKTLTVNGNLAGSGGTFHLNADLSAGLNDLVSIGGTASGNHHVLILGPGRSATDSRQAFKVIDLVNEAAPHTAIFDGVRDIGAYRYGIAQGAAIPTGYSGVGSGADYYLYNTFATSTPASSAINTAASPGVVWYGEMNEIRKRMGDLRMGAPSGDDFWVRTYVGKHTVKPGGSQSFNQIMRGLEIGKDRSKAITGGNRYLGWVAGHGQADSTFNAGGSGSTDSLYFGGYGSWIKDDGSYIDIVGKHNWFRHRFDAPVMGGGTDSASYRTTGLGMSVETGKRIEKGNGVFIEPQMELAALWSQGENYTTTNGLAVKAPDASSLQLRMGAVVGKISPRDGGGKRQIYGKLSWVEELAGQTRTTVDSTSFDASLKGGRLVAGLGFMEDTSNHQLYLDVESAWGKTTSKPWGINLGYRWKQ